MWNRFTAAHGSRRDAGLRVHGGLVTQPEGVCNLGRRMCDGWLGEVLKLRASALQSERAHCDRLGSERGLCRAHLGGHVGAGMTGRGCAAERGGLVQRSSTEAGLWCRNCVRVLLSWLLVHLRRRERSERGKKSTRSWKMSAATLLTGDRGETTKRRRERRLEIEWRWGKGVGVHFIGRGGRVGDGASSPAINGAVPIISVY